MTGGALNLSLLSRGVGEVHSNGHEKVDVYLEPEDYYNFTTHPDRLYLAPLQTNFDHDLDGSQYTTRSLKDSQAYRVPKTFTTRKGALLLFSEDLAQRNTERASKGKNLALNHDDASTSTDAQIALRTVEDLTKSILKYGAQDSINGKVYLKFLRARKDNYERQIRPGFSAKRYLATWTRTWDNSVLDNIIKHGYITERSLYQTNSSAPNLRRRLLYEDLSHMPQPYRLMKSMLLTPSSLSGYTFYRVPTDIITLEEEMEEVALGSRERPGTVHSIQVIRTADDIQEVVDYHELDRESQTNVITDLLVKSAVHYALRKQEEIIESSLKRSLNGQRDFDELEAGTLEFDMKEAVESLLDSQNGKFSLHSSIPEVDDRSIDMAAFQKAQSIDQRSFKKQAFTSGRMSGSDITESDIPSVSARTDSTTSSDFSGLPVLPPIRHTLSPIRDVSREATSQLVILPPIAKGGASLDVPTVNIQPATPQHSTLTASALSHHHPTPTADRNEEGVGDLLVNIPPVGIAKFEAAKSKSSRKINKKDALSDSLNSGILFQPPPLHRPIHAHHETAHLENFHFGHYPVHPSISSLVDSLDVTSRRHWLMMAGGHSESLKGSVVMAPDGEIVSVGGSVVRGSLQGNDVANMNDVLLSYRNEEVEESGISEEEPDNLKRHSLSLSWQSKSFRQRGSLASSTVSKEDLGRLSSTGKYLLWDQASRLSGDSSSQISSISEKDIMDTLADHAHHIAENVLSRSSAGSDLESDVKQAAELWTKIHPKKSVLRALSGGSEAVDEIMRSSGTNSSASSAAEYKSLIAKSLTTAAAKAAGIDPELLTSEPQISPEVLQALSSQSLTPDQIEIVRDGEGQLKIKVKVDLDQAMGGVQHGHIHVAPGSGSEDDQGRRHVSIPADRGSQLSDANIDVISYKVPETVEEEDSKQGVNVLQTDTSIYQPKSSTKETEREELNTGADRTVPLEDISMITDDGVPVTVASDTQKIEASEDIKKLPDEPDHASAHKTSLENKPMEKVQTVKETSLKVPQKSDISSDSKSKKEKKSQEQKEEPFVVGGVDHRNELSLLYGADMPTPGGPPPTVAPPKKIKVDGPPSTVAAEKKNKGKPKEKKPKKDQPSVKKEAPAKKEEKKTKKGKKGKKGKKKGEELTAEQPTTTEVAPPAVEEEKAQTPPPPPPPAAIEPEEEEEPIPSSPEVQSEESDIEFNFVRETTSPPPAEAPPQPKSASKKSLSGPDESAESDEEDESAVSNLKSISNKEARAAKRAAAAAKRREEVERRRREKEEQHRREKEEIERQIALQKEMEEEKRRREEERRLRKLQELESEERERKEQEEAERRRKLEAEREKRAKEEYQRKLEEMRRKQLEEEMRRHEMLLEKQREEERQRLAEELLMSKMAEEERLEYERKKREIEEMRRQRELEERLLREEEARKALEEAQRLAAEMARKQAELEARLRFNRSLQEESSNLTQAHQVNRAFVFSYFELLQWLGLDLPDFETSKQANY